MKTLLLVSLLLSRSSYSFFKKEDPCGELESKILHLKLSTNNINKYIEIYKFKKNTKKIKILEFRKQANLNNINTFKSKLIRFHKCKTKNRNKL